MLGQFYQWLWFHTEWWLTPVDRRPYTFIFRDWIFTHKVAFIACLIGWISGLVILAQYHAATSVIVSVLTAFLLGHLIWGTPWIISQQEFPEYVEADD